MLKVFAGVRCLNKDQLPRYLDGRLTDIEKHLVEQHMVDCDLCFEALQALQHEKFREQYPTLTAGIQRYIRESIKPVSQLQKMEHYLRKARKRENFLIYFWLVAFVVLGAGGVYIMQAHDFKRPVIARPVTPVLNTAAVTNNPPPADNPVKKPASTPLAVAPKPGTTAPGTEQKNVGTPAAGAKGTIVKKDTARLNHPAVPLLKKPADSIKKTTPPATKAPDSLKKTEKKEQAPPKPDTQANTAKNTTPEKTDKESKEPDSSKDKPAEKPAANPSQPPTADEFLYRAAMVYQQQGDMNEAISRLKRLTDNDGRIGEMARYQLGVCYRNKGQMGRARRMFKDVVRLNGSMKNAAQQALDNM